MRCSNKMRERKVERCKVCGRIADTRVKVIDKAFVFGYGCLYHMQNVRTVSFSRIERMIERFKAKHQKTYIKEKAAPTL